MYNTILQNDELIIIEGTMSEINIHEINDFKFHFVQLALQMKVFITE